MKRSILLVVLAASHRLIAGLKTDELTAKKGNRKVLFFGTSQCDGKNQERMLESFQNVSGDFDFELHCSPGWISTSFGDSQPKSKRIEAEACKFKDPPPVVVSFVGVMEIGDPKFFPEFPNNSVQDLVTAARKCDATLLLVAPPVYSPIAKEAMVMQQRTDEFNKLGQQLASSSNGKVHVLNLDIRTDSNLGNHCMPGKPGMCDYAHFCRFIGPKDHCQMTDIVAGKVVGKLREMRGSRFI